jgi:hypothetical protein
LSSKKTKTTASADGSEQDSADASDEDGWVVNSSHINKTFNLAV